MAEKLKECPFCGDEEIRVIRVGTPAVSCIVGCTNCGAELESNEIGSGHYWNDRPQIKDENSNSAELGKEVFVVKHYSEDAHPTIKGYGFDGLIIGETRHEAEDFIKFVNNLISNSLPCGENNK